MDSWGQLIKKLPKNIKKLPVSKKIILTLSIVSFIATCAWFYHISQLSAYTQTNIKVVNDLMTYLSHEEYEKAYDLFADKYKNEESFNTFRKNNLLLKPLYKDYKDNSFKLIKTTRFLLPLNPPTVRYIWSFEYKNGETAQVTTFFIWENDNWKLYIIEFNDPNSRFELIED